MKRDYIDFRLFPDIIYKGIRYSNYDEGPRQMIADANIPFLRAYSVAKENQKLLLIGDGSLGKSTSLRVFEAEMLFQETPCLFYECRSINANDIASVDAVVSHYRNQILIFDAYDELQESIRDSFDRLIDRLNQYEITVIVSSRFDPRRQNNAYSIETKKNNDAAIAFALYETMHICDFTTDQLDCLVDKRISRNSGYFALLKNTMFLSMHLDFERNNLLGRVKYTISTETEFMQQYFKLLYQNKQLEYVGTSTFEHLGEYIHYQRMGDIPVEEESIPEPLMHIFYYEYVKDWTGGDTYHKIISSKQVKFLNYLHGLYLKKSCRINSRKIARQQLPDAIEEVINITPTSDVSESIYYAGQLMRNDSYALQILSTLNDSNLKEQVYYSNILCLFLGYNNDVAEDIPTVFEFYNPIMENDPYSYIYVCDRIHVLKANSIINVKFAYCGLPQLKKININNDIFVTQDNCLIKSESHELYLGCVNGNIPDGVKYVHQHAFTRCPIEKLVLPKTMLVVDQYAFSYCEKLTYVEIGESVVALYRNAFYKCSAIETIHIKNSRMEIGRAAYDLQAFVKVSNLSKAIIPTSAISYIYNLASDTLSYIEIFQGYALSNPRQLTFACIEYPKRWNTIKHLFVRNDVEEISEEAFKQFGNNLESIVVEEGCENFYSVNNCLISSHDETLLLGCKNSKIPDSGVRSIRNYAFARCEGLSEIEIPINIREIEYNCFQECFNLEKIVFKSPKLHIAEGAFIACRNLQSVCIDNLENWLGYEFENTTSNPLSYARELIIDGKKTDDITIPRITEISARAFNHTESIKMLCIPPSVRRIGEFAFVGCKNLRRVFIDDLKGWCNIEFNNYSANPLTSDAIFSSNKEEVEETTSASEELFVSSIKFYLKNEELRDLIVDKGIPIIKKSVFVRCSSLRTVTFTGEKTVVEANAFLKCPNLKKIRINGKSAAIIHPSAFRGCDATMEFVGSESEWKDFVGENNYLGIRDVVFVQKKESDSSILEKESI